MEEPVVLHRLNSATTLIQRTTTEAPDDDYELYRIGRSQEDDQLLREGREWPDTAGRQDQVNPTRAGLLDEDSAPAVDRGDGGDDLQRLDLRSPAAACHPDQGGTSIDAARDCCSQEEERPDRCQQTRRLPEMRLPPGVPHDASSDTGSKAHAEVPASAGAADGADEEPCLRTADGNRRGEQKPTAAQGELLPGTALRERGGSSEPTAAVEAQPGDDRALSKDRVRPAQLSSARSSIGRPDQEAQNRSWRGSDHGSDVGAGDRRCLTLPLDQEGHQLLRPVRR